MNTQLIWVLPYDILFIKNNIVDLNFKGILLFTKESNLEEIPSNISLPVNKKSLECLHFIDFLFYKFLKEFITNLASERRNTYIDQPYPFVRQKYIV